MGPRLAMTNWTRLLNVDAPAVLDGALRKKVTGLAPLLVKKSAKGGVADGRHLMNPNSPRWTKAAAPLPKARTLAAGVTDGRHLMNADAPRWTTLRTHAVAA